MMKKLIVAASVLASFAALATDASPASAALAKAHEKKSMGLQCQQEATAKKLEGAAKKQFMVTCLNAAAAAAAPK
jgi:hypothetical protein